MSEKTLDRRTLMISAGLAPWPVSAAASGKVPGWIERLLKRRFVEPPDERRSSPNSKILSNSVNHDDVTVTDARRSTASAPAALDLSRCVGPAAGLCLRPQEDDHRRNHHPLDAVLKMKDNGIDFAESDIYYRAEECGPSSISGGVPAVRNHLRQGIQSRRPAQTDGIVVIDSDWCLRLPLLHVSLPYGARRFELDNRPSTKSFPTCTSSATGRPAQGC